MSTEGHYCEDCACDEGPHGCVCGMCGMTDFDFHPTSYNNLLLMGIRRANAAQGGLASWENWHRLLMEGIVNDLDGMLKDWSGAEISQAVKVVSRLATIQSNG